MGLQTQSCTLSRLEGIQDWERDDRLLPGFFVGAVRIRRQLSCLAD